MGYWFAEISKGLVPHEYSFGYHDALLAWYEAACWMAAVAWVINIFIVVVIQKKRIPLTTWDMVKPLCYVVTSLVILSAVRWLINGVVLHLPLYQVQTILYLIEAHIGIAIATFGFWYLIRKENNVFERMAKHKRNSERWKTVTDSMRLTGVAEFDEGGNIWFTNPALDRIFGYDREELIGEKITILMPERFRKKHLDSINLFIETGRSPVMDAPVPLEFWGIRKDQSEFAIELTLSCYKIDAAPYRFVAIMRDISYRTKLEKELDAKLQRRNDSTT
jgi:PAS domain S-box-containing protein